MFWLRNLSATGTTAGRPWELPAVGIPDAVRGKAGKKARTAWITDPETQAVVYSAVEGRNERQRVTKSKGDDGNPPHALHALVVDYDVPVTDAELQAGATRLKHPPNVIERTLSGNARAIWLFSQPIRVPGYDFCSDFLQFLGSQLTIEALAPGVDAGALKAPDRYYTWSGEYADISDAPLPHALVQGWFMEFATRWKLRGNDVAGPEIPFEKLIPMLTARYPRFAEWVGDFAEGAMGPSFWIDGSTSPKSALVKSTGMMTWSAHATKAFYSWEDLLGTEAAEYRVKQLGAAVEGIYYDGRHYWRQLPDGSWRPWEKADIRQHLAVSRGISQRPDKKGISDVDRALQHVQDHQHIDGAVPFALYPPGVVRTPAGGRALNTSTRRVLSAADATDAELTWGPTGKFPFLSALHDAIFDPPEQLPHWLAWLSFGYRAGVEMKPRSGTNVIMAGGAGTGKTLLARRIVGPLFGGYAEASDYLMGTDQFGAELFDSAIWCVDDAVVASTVGVHRKFSELLKKMAANTTFRYHAKFRQATLVDWRGRVIVTCNRDEVSMRIIPDLTISIRDKLSLFRCVERYPEGGFTFPGGEETEAMVEAELPYFAAWLLRYKPPEDVKPDPRFGWAAYTHPDLARSAHQSSWGAVFGEIVDAWRALYFGAEDNKATQWRGTAFQLYTQFQCDPAIAAALRTVTPDNIGRSLALLKASGDDRILCEDAGAQRIWTILK